MALAKFYGVPHANQWRGTNAINYDADDMRTSLHSTSYVPAQDTHDFFNDATNELAATGGYTLLGYDHVTHVCTYDTASDRIHWIPTAAVWTSATFSPGVAVHYKNNAGTAATSPLFSYLDFQAAQPITNGTFTIQWDATDGVGYIDIT